jgi:glucose/arabinose dehydrogenase
MIARCSILLLCAMAICASEPPRLAAVQVCDRVESPVWVGTPPQDANRLFVCEQRTGRIRIYDRAAKAWKPEPALTVAPLRSQDHEQGLLGLAFHPQFAKNGWFYIYATVPEGGPAGQLEISRYTMRGDQADPASKLVIIAIEQPHGNHNGGWIDFGPDGCLWLGVGDGGGGDDRFGKIGNGQDLRSLHGKLLRLDVSKEPYAIPRDNPFAKQLGKLPEIAAFGLRNPWRCSFDEATGDLWIGDVGQNQREEINVLPKGRLGLNFGWRPREGLIQNPSFPKEQPVTKAIDPILDYDRSQGRVSVTGGFVYRGKAIPGLAGWYLFADFAAQRLYRVDADEVRKNRKAVMVEISDQLNPQLDQGQISTFGADADGELFYAAWNTGRIYQIVAAP